MMAHDFSSYLTKIGKMPATAKAFVGKEKKYMRLVHSILLTKEDVQNYVTMSIDVESDEELKEKYQKEILQIR